MNIVIQQLVPESKTFEAGDLHFFVAYPETQQIEVFDEKVLEFFEAISKKLMQHPDLGKIPEIVALAFWLRKGNLNQIVKEHQYLLESKRYKVYPLGTVFHICPANVDTMFLYSLAISLLNGNKNILRVSNKLKDSYVWILFDVINEILQDNFSFLKSHIRIISYERDTEINTFFSVKCDARIIWGGNETVNTFRKTESNVRGKDLVFADRYSAALVHSGALISASETELKQLGAALYNDAYSFDQKGCSCPQLLFFLGDIEENQKAESMLYSYLLKEANSRYQTDISSLASLKLMQETMDAIRGNAKNILNEKTELVFCELAENAALPENCGGGYFYTRKFGEIKELEFMMGKGFQTLTYWGLNKDQIEMLANVSAGKGIDRIVPVGKALEFGHIWDGYNLVEELMSRKLIL
ncbi:MAG: hypothetical protein KG003_06255 [Bacteroidetes bacterium]|nr:hypothetical protein [Bacteroidota bacterium]